MESLKQIWRISGIQKLRKVKGGDMCAITKVNSAVYHLETVRISCV